MSTKNLGWIVCLVVQTAWAQSEYKADAIPAALKENAHSVVRRQETVFTVKSPGEATERIHSVITILDKEADDQATMAVWYDKLSKITNLEGSLYDADGKLIKKLKKSDIRDYSSYGDYNLFDDNRFKSAVFPKQPTYPYTVEFLVETTEHNLMFYPTWMPQRKEYVAVEQASYTIQMPAGLALRYKEDNLSTPVTQTTLADGGKAYTWKLVDRLAVEFEPLSPPAREQLPAVYTAPTDFEVQGYKGSVTSWNDIGRFYDKLNDGRDQIPADVRQSVTELTKDEPTKRGKVQKLYQLLQHQTRYVSVQLGIGGWQTIEADKVAASKYGDCKALTNYTKALLKAANITAYTALVRAGADEADVQVDFPSFQFNHVILCVPDGRDTLFLECTAGYGVTGYTGNFTGNRHALLVLPGGGRLINTPVYRPTDNRQERQLQITVGEQGDATARVKTRYSGLQQESCARAVHTMNHEDQRNWLLKRISLPAFELTSFSYVEQPVGTLPVVTETMDLDIRHWATASGSRLYLPLNPLSTLSPAAPLTQARKASLYLRPSYDFEDSDTITYQLPKGYRPEFMILPVAIHSKFGDYAAQASVDGDRVRYTRRVRMQGGRFPATAYADWVDFRKKVAKADRMQMVFVKTN